MWTSIIGLVIGGLPAIAREIAKAKVDLSKARNEQEKNEIEERIRTLQVRADALAKQQATPWTVLMQFLFVAPAAFYWAWTVPGDKIICKWFVATENVDRICSTDPLASWQMNIMMIIVTFFFVGQITQRILGR